ncbi:MAG: branched-chain amino acid ABC transporter substrate-binding protein [Bifidobacteriaceae bacterium]|jgi:branched-chain amino acid transport system substrate-binding protein|nr:branched-chain amino acid ABC transporter substrate-binding protein [Bifidobacteriaceae bacterium]
MKRPSPRHTVALALASAVILTLAGCSGGLGNTEDAATDDAAGQPADSGDENSSEPIKLGMLGPFSGSESAFGPYMANGANLAIQEINADGGVLGRPLELVTEDDACDATTAVAGANKLTTQGVVASVGGYCSSATVPTVDILTGAGMPMVIPAANSNQLVELGNPKVFLVNGTGTQQAASALAYAEHSGLAKVALLHDNSSYSKDLADSFNAQVGDGDVSSVLTEGVNKEEKDFSATVNNVLGAEPDLVWWTGYYDAGGLLAKQLHDAGYDGQIMVADGSVDAKLAEIAGPDASKGIVGTFTQTPDMLEGHDDWIEDYTEMFGDPPGPYATQAYDAVRIIAQAMTDAGTTDGDAVTTALEAIDGMELFSGPLKFTPEHTLSSGGFVIVEVGPDGTFVFKENPVDY